MTPPSTLDELERLAAELHALDVIVKNRGTLADNLDATDVEECYRDALQDHAASLIADSRALVWARERIAYLERQLEFQVNRRNPGDSNSLINFENEPPPLF